MQQEETLQTELRLCRQTTEKLQEECQLSTAILDTINAFVMVFDLKGHLIRYNRAWKGIIGYTLDEVKNFPFWELFLTQEEKEPVKAIFKQLQVDKLAIAYESNWINKNGSVINLQLFIIVSIRAEIKQSC